MRAAGESLLGLRSLLRVPKSDECFECVRAAIRSRPDVSKPSRERTETESNRSLLEPGESNLSLLEPGESNLSLLEPGESNLSLLEPSESNVSKPSRQQRTCVQGTCVSKPSRPSLAYQWVSIRHSLASSNE